MERTPKRKVGELSRFSRAVSRIEVVFSEFPKRELITAMRNAIFDSSDFSKRLPALDKPMGPGNRLRSSREQSGLSLLPVILRTLFAAGNHRHILCRAASVSGEIYREKLESLKHSSLEIGDHFFRPMDAERSPGVSFYIYLHPRASDNGNFQ